MGQPEPSWVPFFKSPTWTPTTNEAPDTYGVLSEGATERLTEKTAQSEYDFAASIVEWAEVDPQQISQRYTAVMLVAYAAIKAATKSSEVQQEQLSRLLEHLVPLLYKSIMRKSGQSLTDLDPLDEEQSETASNLLEDWTATLSIIEHVEDSILTKRLGSLLWCVATNMTPSDAYCILIGTVHDSEFPASYARIPVEATAMTVARMETGRAKYVVSLLSLLMSIIRRVEKEEGSDDDDNPVELKPKPWALEGLILVSHFCLGMGEKLYQLPPDDVHNIARNSIFSGVGRVLDHSASFLHLEDQPITVRFASDPQLNTEMLEYLQSMLKVFIKVQQHSSIVELASAVNLLVPATESISEMELNPLSLSRVCAMTCILTRFGPPVQEFQPMCFALSPGTLLASFLKPMTVLAGHGATNLTGHLSAEYLFLRLGSCVWDYVPVVDDEVFQTEHGFHVALEECVAKFAQLLAHFTRNPAQRDNELTKVNSQGLKSFLKRFPPRPAAEVLTKALRYLHRHGLEALKPTTAAWLLARFRDVEGYDKLACAEALRVDLFAQLEKEAVLSTWAKVIHEFTNMISLSADWKRKSRKALEDLRNRIELVMKVDSDQNLILGALAFDHALD